ncbi:MAG: M48 family metallopeptidase [Proteobacteria bacterium]|nr:M48 family metallopeptidase [Pseudomonadota bacterium]
MLQAQYVDGRSTRVRTVSLSVSGTDLVITADDLQRAEPLAGVVFDEQLGNAPRRVRLADGAFCEVRDLDGLRALMASARLRDGWVDRAQRHLPWVLMSVVGCVALVAAGYRWGLPWGARMLAQRLPPAISAMLSRQTLKALDGGMLLPSQLDGARQASLRSQFQALRLPDGEPIRWTLLFRRSPALGANAFTLPDGTIVLLDDLVAQLDNDQQVMAVLAHELGHAQGRHGMQLLLRSSAVGAFLAFYLGDFSQLLAAAPAALAQARYSQSLEWQADEYGSAVMRANGMSPALLADALRLLSKSHHDAAGVSYLTSHPPTAERMRRLEELAQLRPVQPSH